MMLFMIWKQAKPGITPRLRLAINTGYHSPRLFPLSAIILLRKWPCTLWAMMLLRTGFFRSEISLRPIANILLLSCLSRNAMLMAGNWADQLTIQKPGATWTAATPIFMVTPRPPMMLTGLFIVMAEPMKIARWLSSSSVHLIFLMAS